jgi:hypothetical protein
MERVESSKIHKHKRIFIKVISNKTMAMKKATKKVAKKAAKKAVKKVAKKAVKKVAKKAAKKTAKRK